MKIHPKNLNDYDLRGRLEREGWQKKLEAIEAITLEDLDLYRNDLELKIEYGRISFAICLPDERCAPNGFSLTVEDLNRLDAKELTSLVTSRLREHFGKENLPDYLVADRASE